MKKVVLLASLFLVGMTAQAFTNHQSDAISNPGKHNRYKNTQEISFVENGILFTVTTNGYFRFKQLDRWSPKDRYNRRDKNHLINYRPHNNQSRYTNNRYRPQSLRIKRDAYGYITRIGSLPIFYNNKGKVKHIGSVRMKYRKGQLVRIGNMTITYNRFGNIRDTFGYINSLNNFWHDDCNLQHEDHWNHHHNNRRENERDRDDNDQLIRREERIRT